MKDSTLRIIIFILISIILVCLNDIYDNSIIITIITYILVIIGFINLAFIPSDLIKEKESKKPNE